MTCLPKPVNPEVLSAILDGKNPLAADVGGRYGLHRYFRPLLGLGHVVIFDADPDAENLDLDELISVRAGLSSRGGPQFVSCPKQEIVRDLRGNPCSS